MTAAALAARRLRAMTTARARRNARDQFELTAYRGAEVDRAKQEWTPETGSADELVLPELQTLRDRSRDLNRNDPFAAALTRAIVDLVVGRGFRPQCRLNVDRLGISESQAGEFQDAAERVFESWEATAHIAGEMHFRDLQALAFRSQMESGDLMVNLPVLPERTMLEEERDLGLAVELVEADRVRTPSGMESNETIRDGVEIGARGQKIAFHVEKAGAVGRYYRGNAETRRVSRRNRAGRIQMLHLLEVERPNQTRGVPAFAPVLSFFDDLQGVFEGEFFAQRIQACFSTWIETPNANQVSRAAANSRGKDGRPALKLDPLAINMLDPGMKPHFANPNRPGGTFEPFVARALRAIGATVGIPLELFTKDYSKTTFHSGRAALLDAWRTIQRLQQRFAQQFLTPIWRLFLEEAWLRGELPDVPLLDQPREYCRVRWVPAQGRIMVEPDKELKAAEMRIDMGLSTHSEEASQIGADYEENVRQLAKEEVMRQQIREAAGLAAPPQPGETDDDDEVETPEGDPPDEGQEGEEEEQGGADDDGDEGEE